VKRFFTSYLRQTWIGTPSKPPRFNPQMWSMWDVCLENKPTTNNAVESFNRSWNLSVGSSPSVWKVIRSIKQEICLADKKTVELMNGQHRNTNPGRKLNVKEFHDKRVSCMKSYKKHDLHSYKRAMYKLV